MYVTDRNWITFDPGGDFISPDDINSGLDNLQATDRIKKLNSKEF